MSLDKLLNYVAEGVRKELLDAEKVKEEAKKKPPSFRNFRFERAAGTLIESCKTCAKHHRSREQHYTTCLEEAEKELREKGVTVEAYDPQTGYTPIVSGSFSLCSGAINSPTTTFQPRIDQRLLDKVKSAKQKMLEHRDKAEDYEKLWRAYSLAPDTVLDLNIEDAHFFRLGVE